MQEEIAPAGALPCILVLPAELECSPLSLLGDSAQDKESGLYEVCCMCRREPQNFQNCFALKKPQNVLLLLLCSRHQLWVAPGGVPAQPPQCCLRPLGPTGECSCASEQLQGGFGWGSTCSYCQDSLSKPGLGAHRSPCGSWLSSLPLPGQEGWQECSWQQGAQAKGSS